MLKPILLVSSLTLSVLPGLSAAQNNFATTEGIQKSCELQEKKAFKLGNSNADKQSQVLCRDLALLKQVIHWFDELKVNPNRDYTSKEFDAFVRKELSHVRKELSASRQALEKLQLKSGEGLVMEPAQWQLDLNGDGKLSTWEKYFFAVVKPGERPISFSLPSDDVKYYQEHFNLQARFQVDQSDVYWTLAYHQFFEGLVNMVLSFQIDVNDRKQMRIKMIDQATLQKSHALIGSGLATSEKMRLSLLAESDDKDEWIPNPQQKNHVFPLAMDQEAFDIWGRFLNETIPLWNGKTLLAASKTAGGPLGASARICEPGKGLNVAELFRKAPNYFDTSLSVKYACMKIDQDHPTSQLTKMAEEALERGRNNPKSPEWNFLRYLYWVN